MKAKSLIIPQDELNELKGSLEIAGQGGQWLVVPEARPPEVVVSGPRWQHQSGQRPVILHPNVKVSIGLPAHLSQEVAHYHQSGVEMYNFRGPTVIKTIKLKPNAEVQKIELPNGGYYIAYPDDECHFILKNLGGWDNFYFANQLMKPGDPADKVVCKNCFFRGQCALENAFIK